MSDSVNHATCAASAHDRSLPEPLDAQAVADDGQLACNDCGRPAFYCANDESYHHVDRGAVCFLIRD